MTLFTGEVFWRDRYTFFLSRGYKLRPRYHPDWVPSWEGKDNVILSFCEDRIAQLKSNLLDATHVDSGKPVFIKKIESNYYPDEVKIAMYLSSIKDARNHCVKVLELFRDERDASVDYIVMPVYRPFNQPDFTTIGEVIAFVTQTLEVRWPVISGS
ncbi:hypothetical protein HYDPIDRAFT_120370, partial [Hydnomerulius pinastri MD-312]